MTGVMTPSGHLWRARYPIRVQSRGSLFGKGSRKPEDTAHGEFARGGAPIGSTPNQGAGPPRTRSLPTNDLRYAACRSCAAAVAAKPTPPPTPPRVGNRGTLVKIGEVTPPKRPGILGPLELGEPIDHSGTPPFPPGHLWGDFRPPPQIPTPPLLPPLGLATGADELAHAVALGLKPSGLRGRRPTPGGVRPSAA